MMNDCDYHYEPSQWSFTFFEQVNAGPNRNVDSNYWIIVMKKYKI